MQNLQNDDKTKASERIIVSPQGETSQTPFLKWISALTYLLTHLMHASNGKITYSIKIYSILHGPCVCVSVSEYACMYVCIYVLIFIYFLLTDFFIFLYIIMCCCFKLYNLSLPFNSIREERKHYKSLQKFRRIVHKIGCMLKTLVEF